MTGRTQSIALSQGSADPTTAPRLTGAWLLAARIAWIFLALVALVILTTSLPGYAQAFSGQLSHFVGEEQSLSVTILAILSGLASLAAALLSLTLAAVFFRNRFSEPAAAALSFYLLTSAIVMAGPLE